MIDEEKSVNLIPDDHSKLLQEIEAIDNKAEEEAEAKRKMRKEKKAKVKPAKEKKTRTGYLKIMQHICIAIVAVSLLVVVTGSTVAIPHYDGTQTYSMSSSDEGRKYGDSVLFNTILGNETSDVLKLITIRTQMETNGIYDSKKVIDINQFNTRENISSAADTGVTACYYLGDLLKWSRYGFDYESLTQSQMGESANSLASNMYDGTGTTDTYSDSENYYTMLVNRYTTVDGQTLEDIATTWEEYNDLVNQLQLAADDLYSNYTDYLGLSDYYNVSNSNIRYCVVMGQGDSKVIYTNDDDIDTSMSSKDILQIFKGYGKYILLNEDNMRYTTNTAITESVFNALLSDYEYAFSDDSKIYVGVDMSLLAEDGIKTGSLGYNKYQPYYKQLYLCIALFSIFYLVLLVICTINEGRICDVNGKTYIRATAFDNTSLELWIILTGIFAAAIPAGINLLFSTYDGQTTKLMDIIYSDNFRIIFGLCVFLYDIILMGLYYSLVRRIKGRNIWKNTLLNKLIIFSRKTILLIYDNGSIITRTWIPFAVTVILNILLIVLMKHGGIRAWLLGIILVILDIIVGNALYKHTKERADIIFGMKKVIAGDLSYKADTANLYGDNKELGTSVNSISDAVRNAVEKSTKDDRMKTDLVANVSHDIRTPLTSIINYVDLLKREDIQNENALNYIAVIDEKSQRLKTLTEDLIEASKVSSGNVELNLVRMDLKEFVGQAVAEFGDKFEEKNLSCMINSSNLSAPVLMADGKSLWRVMENLFGNVCKYAMPGTRVYVDLFNVEADKKKLIVMQIKNISSSVLPDDLSDLTERFIRGDASRNSEGNGLGLSIAKSLTELMDGKFELASDGDLFKVEISFNAEA